MLGIISPALRASLVAWVLCLSPGSNRAWPVATAVSSEWQPDKEARWNDPRLSAYRSALDWAGMVS